MPNLSQVSGPAVRKGALREGLDRPGLGVSTRLKSRRSRKRLKLTLITIVAALAMLYALFPVYWVLIAALDPRNSLATQQFIPSRVSLANFNLLLADPTNPFLVWLFNSLKISVITAAISVLLTTLAAYAFSRFRFRGRRQLMKGIVLVQVFPNMLALVSLYLIVQQIGQFVPALGLNTHGALILVYLGGILGGNVWLMKGYIDSIPRELDESAMMDGAPHWRIFWEIILPLARPMLAVTAVLVFVGTYGEVILARVLLKGAQQLTLPVGLWTYVGGFYTERWGPFAAGALISALPALVIFYLLQDWLVSGLTSGAVKS